MGIVSEIPTVVGVDRLMWLSTMASVTSKPKAVPKKWSAIKEMLREPGWYASKAACPLLKLATFNGPRSNETMHEVHGIEGDHDAGTMRLEEAAELLRDAGIEALIYPTASHTSAAPRWRVLAPLSMAFEPPARAEFVDRLNGALRGALAGESWTASQPYFYGRVDGMDYEALEVLGRFIDEIDVDPIGRAEWKEKPPRVAPLDDLDRAVTLADVTDETVADFISALGVLDADDRQTWVDAGLAAKSLEQAGRSEAFEAWRDWSARSDKYDYDEAVEKWNGFEPREITFRSVFRLAQAAGWSNPRKGIAKDAPATLAASDRPRFAIQRNEFLSRQAPGWWVRHVLPRAPLVMVFGEPKSGKSFTVLDLVMAVARGVEWNGKRVRQGRVVYIAAEGQGGFVLRIRAYLQRHEIVWPSAFGLITDAPNLLAAADVDDVVARIEDDGGADVIVIDTLARVTPGANENSGEDMGNAQKHCAALTARTGATVLLVHHSGKDKSKGARGWSGWKGAVDAEIEVEKLADSAGSFRVSEMKDGPADFSVKFRREVVALGVDDEGDVIDSCVVDYDGDAPARRNQKPLGFVQRAVMDEIGHRLGDLDADEDGGVNEELVRKSVFETLEKPASGRDKRGTRIDDAFDTLVKRELIRIEEGRIWKL